MGAINDAVEKPHIVTLAEGSGSPMPMPMPTLTLIFKALAAYRRKAVTFAIAIINFIARVVILRSALLVVNGFPLGMVVLQKNSNVSFD